MANQYRLNKVLDLNPMFISLGLPSSAFKTFNPAIPPAFFDAVVNAGPLHRDCIWLFKGADYHRYNLRERSFEVRDRPISDFCKQGSPKLPPAFANGIDTVAYGGSAFPTIYYFFTGETYVRLNAAVDAADTDALPAQALWSADEGPRGVLGAWSVGLWTKPDGTFIRPGRMVALHGEGSPFVGQVHFFRHGEYLRHDLRNGGVAQAPVPISDAWQLPAPFNQQIDAAFYGVGAEAQMIYFLSGSEFVLYDPESVQILRQGKADQEFPGFASFMTRPQLFLVEYCSLRTYLGPLQDGELVDSRSIGPGETLHRVLVIETIDSTISTVQTSILEQQDASTVKDLGDRVAKDTSQNEGGESYRYHLNADAHGDASATGFWGGEVNANLAVQGGSDSLRNNFARSVFSAVTSQVTESRRQQITRSFTSTDQIEHSERVLNIQEFTQKNTSNQIMNIAFVYILQAFVGLLTLNTVRVAYSDGFNPRVVDLHELPQLLDDLLTPVQSKDQVLTFVSNELSKIVDAENQPRSLLAEGNNGLMLAPTIRSACRVITPNGTSETIEAPGIIKSSKDWLSPTRSIIGRFI